MTKATTFQIQSRQVVGTLEDQHKYDLPTLRRLGVAADPVNMEIKPATSDAMKLAEALAAAKPELNSITNSIIKQTGDDAEELGVKEGLTSGDLSYDQAVEAAAGKHPRYIAGFMRSKGFVQGEQLYWKFKQDWESADKTSTNEEGTTTFNPDQWISNWWKENTQGFSHPQFVSGMNKVMAKAIGEAKADWEKETLTIVDAQRENNWQTFLQGDLKMDNWTPDLYAQRAKDWLDVNGGHPRDLVRYTANMAKVAAENGDVATVEKLMALKNHVGTDGVKPYAKAFGNDQEMIAKAASNFGLAREYKKKAETAKIMDDLEGSLTDIALQGVTGDLDGARDALDKLKADPRFRGLGFEKIIQLNNTFQNAFKKEETREAQMMASDLLVKIHTGKAGYDSVVDALRDNKIAPSQANMLFNAIKSNQLEARKLAAEDRAAARLERNALKETILRSSFAHLDRMNTEMLGQEAALRYEQGRALLIYSATQELPDVLSSKDPSAKQEFILKYQKRAEEFYKQTINAEAPKWDGYQPKYKSKKELEAAVNKHGMTVELMKEAEYWTWKMQSGQAK